MQTSRRTPCFFIAPTRFAVLAEKGSWASCCACPAPRAQRPVPPPQPPAPPDRARCRPAREAGTLEVQRQRGCELRPSLGDLAPAPFPTRSAPCGLSRRLLEPSLLLLSPFLRAVVLFGSLCQ